jgi:carboxypeptidase Taq
MRPLTRIEASSVTINPVEAYRRLEQTFARISVLRSVNGLLGWDSNVALPREAAPARSRQTAVVSDIIAQSLAAPDLPDLVRAAAQGELSEWEAANLREMEREIRLNAATPSKLSSRLAGAASICEMAWRDAKTNDDFGQVRTPLENLFSIARDIASARGESIGLSAFDAMMEVWEPGARVEALDPAFDRLARSLPKIAAEAVSSSPVSPSSTEVHPPAVLLRAAHALAAHLGLTATAGRLDPCKHAFFMDDNPDDIRIGLRLDEGPLMPSLRGLIHEIGHVRYERNGPPAWRGQPVGRSRSASIQESQALLLEMMVGGSDAFWRSAAPIVAREIGRDEADIDWRGSLTCVRPGPLRVGADEVTYGLHIVLRYRLERDLIERRLEVRDLPDAWREQFKTLFGFSPAGDREGCLQDIHWYSGLLGYFPSYAQGQWAAAQFAAAAERALPGLWDGDGRLDELADWLKVHVHGVGSRLTTDELFRSATGASLSPDDFIDHLTRRYLDGRPS